MAKKKSNIIQFNQEGKVKFINNTEKKSNEPTKFILTRTGDDIRAEIYNGSILDIIEMITNSMNTIFEDNKVAENDLETLYLKADFIAQLMDVFNIHFDDLVCHLIACNVSGFAQEHGINENK